MPEELKKSQTKKASSKKSTKKTATKKSTKKVKQEIVEEQVEKKYIDILIPIIDKVDSYKTMIDELLNRKEDLKIVIGVREKLVEKLSQYIGKKNVIFRVFANESKKEEILNSLSDNVGKGKFIVLRRPLKPVDLDKFINSNADLTYFSRKRSKISAFFYNFFKNIIVNLFGFHFFDDMSAIGFGENINDLMSNFKNLSYCSRFNRYVGLTKNEIETTEKNALPEYDKTPVILKFVLAQLLLLGSIAGMVIISIFCNVKVLIVLLFILWALVVVAISFVSIVVLVQNISIGSLRFEKAKEI